MTLLSPICTIIIPTRPDYIRFTSCSFLLANAIERRQNEKQASEWSFCMQNINNILVVEFISYYYFVCNNLLLFMSHWDAWRTTQNAYSFFTQFQHFHLVEFIRCKRFIVCYCCYCIFMECFVLNETLNWIITRLSNGLRKLTSIYFILFFECFVFFT